MGSGVLKTLPSYKVSHNEFLYIFSHGGHASEPHVCLLLWHLSVSDRYLVFVKDTSVVYYCLPSLTLSLVPYVLGTVVT